VLSHEYLLREVWGLEHIGDSNYLRLYIRYLRRKLEKDPQVPGSSRARGAWGTGSGEKSNAETQRPYNPLRLPTGSLWDASLRYVITLRRLRRLAQYDGR